MIIDMEHHFSTEKQLQKRGRSKDSQISRSWKNGFLSGAITSVVVPVPNWLASISAQMSATLGTQISFKRPPEWQKLLQDALAAPDTAQQKDLSQQLNKMTHDQALVVVPYVYSRGFLWQKYVMNGDATAWGGECVRKNTIEDVWLNK